MAAQRSPDIHIGSGATTEASGSKDRGKGQLTFGKSEQQVNRQLGCSSCRLRSVRGALSEKSVSLDREQVRLRIRSTGTV